MERYNHLQLLGVNLLDPLQIPADGFVVKDALQNPHLPAPESGKRRPTGGIIAVPRSGGFP
jgi:hypothetical protein